MLFMVKQFIFYYFLKPVVAYCGLIAIYGYLTGNQIEPIIGNTLNLAFQIGFAGFNAAQEAFPLLLTKLQELGKIK